jgi:hypothetical protein
MVVSIENEFVGHPFQLIPPNDSYFALSIDARMCRGLLVFKWNGLPRLALKRQMLRVIVYPRNDVSGFTLQVRKLQRVVVPIFHGRRDFKKMRTRPRTPIVSCINNCRNHNIESLVESTEDQEDTALYVEW